MQVVEMDVNGISLLVSANAAFRNGKFDDAISQYEAALCQADKQLKSMLRFNLEFAKRKRDICHYKNKPISIFELKEKLNRLDEVDTIYPFFDVDYYIYNNPNIIKEKSDPVEHYCTVGWRNLLNPHPDFSTILYLESNPDVREAGINPFWHWIKFGRSEGREGKLHDIDKLINPIAKPHLFHADVKIQKLVEPIDIIVPIFNAYEDLCECLDCLDMNTDGAHRIILINDASTDKRINLLCHEFVEKRNNCIFLENSTNLGFIKTVNRGFEHAIGHVVLLNTDAFVPVNWVDRLMAPIVAYPKIASVTPMTNNGEIANVPVICKNISLSSSEVKGIDKIASQFNPLMSFVEVPTGVGFCMGLSKHWLKKIPEFDVSFGRGYGEEVDWCQRVIKQGGKHVLTSSLFVEHRGGMSFGSEKLDRIKENNKKITLRYPNYDMAVQNFIKEDPAISQRLALAFAYAAIEGSVSIYLGHRLGGGAELWLADIIKQNLKSGNSTVTIRDGDISHYLLVELHSKFGVTRANVPINELRSYTDLFSRKDVYYSCLVASRSPLNIMEEVYKSLNIGDKFVILFHDYFPICPSYTLIGSDGHYCGTPDQTDCRACYNEIAMGRPELSTSIDEWRRRWSVWLDRANEIRVFSKSSKKIVLDIWPHLTDVLKITPHPMDWLPPKLKKVKNKIPVVGVLGSIGYQKGARVLKEIAEYASGRFKIVVLGDFNRAFWHPNITVHGKYERREIKELSEYYSIDRWFIPSIWPETFSFTTRECLETGLPVYSFDIGAQAEAIRSNEHGRVVPLRIGIEELISNLTEF